MKKHPPEGSHSPQQPQGPGGGQAGTRDRSRPDPDQRDWLRTTLGSIGDGVITTDTDGRVTFLNPVAEALTGWPLRDALGVPLETVFRIVNEETRREVENPAIKALREGLVVGLANHTLLIARDGAERPIDDSAAPIRDAAGVVGGVVLVFRDVTERREAERALRLSEERFRSLVEGVKDYAIITLDPLGHITAWNAGAEHIKGYRAEEILGRHFSCFYPAEVVASGWPERELEGAASAGRFEDENWRVRKDGSRFWANVVITALRDGNGSLIGFSKITRDLTVRKQAEDSLRASEERNRALTRSAKDAIISGDESGNIVGWNEAACAIFGYTDDEVLRRPLTLLMPERYREAHQAGLARQFDGGPSHVIGRTIELHGRRKDGREFPLELSLSMTHTEQGRFYLGIIRDITERRELEQQRLRFEQAAAQAEALGDINRRKDEFLAMLSHELRNPLSAIINAVHLLRLGKDDDPVQQQARTIVERQVGRLANLVDDLLEVSRITTGRILLRCEHVDFRGLVERALETMRPRIERARHALSVSLPEEPVWLHADPSRMEQVVANLLDNAAKYTENGGRVELELRLAGAQAVLAVRDSGVGVAPELLPRIFDLFTQADRSLDRAQGGLGIGLTVVKRVVEIHGGSVEATSAGIGQGSEFTVRLPVAPPPQESPADPVRAPDAPPSAALRILVVDDNKDTADSAAAMVRGWGHHARVAYAGGDALASALASPPEVLLLDIGLPGIDGYEVARRLRRDARLADTLIVAVSGYGQDVDRERSRQAGFDVHLLKPVEPETLRELLATRKPRGGV